MTGTPEQLEQTLALVDDTLVEAAKLHAVEPAEYQLEAEHAADRNEMGFHSQLAPGRS